MSYVLCWTIWVGLGTVGLPLDPINHVMQWSGGVTTVCAAPALQVNKYYVRRIDPSLHDAEQSLANKLYKEG